MNGKERIQGLAIDIKDPALLKIIEMLLNRSDMDDKYLNEEKSLKQMVEFIKERAKKRANNGMAMIEDVEVYNWVIHYWDESNSNLGITNQTKKETSSEIKDNIEPMLIEKNKPSQKVELKKQNQTVISEGQLTLF